MKKEVKMTDVLKFLDTRAIQYRFSGNYESSVTSYSSLKHVTENSITWVKDVEKFDICQLSVDKQAVIVADIAEREYKNYNIINCHNPKKVFFEILDEFFVEKSISFICEDAVIETERIGKNVSIGHHCYIGKDVVIGNNVTIKNNVQIECPAEIGDSTVINSGVVIGTDGFGYYQDEEGQYRKVPHLGGVKIGKSVEIGANTCIDRGTMDDTWIEDNVKIDNLCHIAHNVQIGKNSLVIALSMLGGSCELKQNSYIAPGCLIKNQIQIGENSFVGMGAVVLKDVEDRKLVAGVPAKVLRDN